MITQEIQERIKTEIAADSRIEAPALASDRVRAVVRPEEHISIRMRITEE